MSHSIKIVHVVHSLDIGGLENGLVNLLNHLDGRFSHSVVCLSKSGRMAQRIKARPIDIVEMGLPTDRFRFPIVKLARVLRELSPDIVHTRGWSSVDAISAAKVARIPTVVHGEHGWEASDPAGQNRKRNLVRRCLSPLVDRFVAVSDDLRNWLVETVGIPESKIIRIHNGVDTQRFAPLWDWQSAKCMTHGASFDVAQGERVGAEGGQKKAAGSLQIAGSNEQAAGGGERGSLAHSVSSLRKSLGLPVDGVLIGTVGRLDPVKDHPTLLQAFATVARDHETARLAVVGDGPMRGHLDRRIRELGIADGVRLLGERQDVPELLNAFDIFALTSVAEGISNTILEAMASGLPIVATRVGGNPELVQDGATGRLIGAGDVTGVAAALGAYIKEPKLRIQHGRAARARAERDFSLDRMAAQYADLYDSVAQTNA